MTQPDLQRTWLEIATTALQALSALAVPLAVAWIGFLIQQSVAKQTTAKDYVALAIEILKVEPKKDSGIDPLRDWAVDVLLKNSPVPISETLQAQLRIQKLIIDAGPVRAVERSSASADAEAITSSPTPTDGGN